MGCSPSKGKLFSKPENGELQKTLLAEPPVDTVPYKPVQTETKVEDKENKPSTPTEESHITETASNTTNAQSKEDVQNIVDNAAPQDVVSNILQTEKTEKSGKQKKHRGKRRSTEKQRKSSVQTKVDFPPHMVRAHQAAYTFLNPNISKYETLLGLLDQVAQIQLSLQPRMATFLLHFEEINQALEEMAEEGELMLKEHWDHMTTPSGMAAGVMSAKRSPDIPYPSNPPPDLLQQLLQHSMEKMKQVGGSVQAVGDNTLEEAVKYFSSLSELLVTKMEAKQAAEQRLSQVLLRVERAAMKKSNPEDTALHSEDSGIGGENESLTGSERHRRHRGSAGSASCGSGVNVRSLCDNISSNLPHLVGHNENDEEEEEEDDEDDDEYEDDDMCRPGRKRLYSSPAVLSSSHENDLHCQQSAVKRPLTAAKPDHSSLNRSVNVIAELQKSQRVLDQRMKKMSELKASEWPHYNIYRAGFRRFSLNGSVGTQKGPLKTNLSMLPQPPERPSVRRLINTFSQGVDGRPGQSLDNIPPHIRRPKRSGNHASNVINCGEEGLINGNNNNNSWPDSRDVLDVDSLPPPPPEVLMDNSFQEFLPAINQKSGTCQRLKAAMQNMEVLPNRAGMRTKPNTFSRPAGQDDVEGLQNAEQQPDTELDSDKKNNCLQQQAHKIIHLQNSSGPIEGNVDPSRRAGSLQANMRQRSEGNELHEAEVSSCILPVIAPPVSRVRLPPSGPPVRQQFSVLRHQFNSSSGPPKTVTHATHEPTEIIPSVSFRDARSVFCRNENSSDVLPGPWGEASRGRQTTRRMDNSTRRTQSQSTPIKKDEPLNSKHRSVSPLTTRDAAYSNISTNVTTT